MTLSAIEDLDTERRVLSAKHEAKECRVGADYYRENFLCDDLADLDLVFTDLSFQQPNTEREAEIMLGAIGHHVARMTELGGLAHLEALEAQGEAVMRILASLRTYYSLDEAERK